MEIQLKEALLIYSERFPDGHPLKDIALTTLHELDRENPFGRHIINNRNREYQIQDEYGREFRTISDACYSLDTRGAQARNDIRRVLKKYDLKLI